MDKDFSEEGVEKIIPPLIPFTVFALSPQKEPSDSQEQAQKPDYLRSKKDPKHRYVNSQCNYLWEKYKDYCRDCDNTPNEASDEPFCLGLMEAYQCCRDRANKEFDKNDTWKK